MTHTTDFTLLPDHDIRNVHGAPGWFELTTADPESACRYLGEVYGWTFEQIDVAGAPYRVARVQGHEIGGVRAPMPGDADVPRWDTYVTVDDVHTFAADAAGAGGQIVVAPMQLGEVGRLSVAVHPAAGTMHAFQYARQFT
jgi:hypothetical protein